MNARVATELRRAPEPALVMVGEAVRSLAGLAGLLCDTSYALLALSGVDIAWHRPAAGGTTRFVPDIGSLLDFSATAPPLLEIENTATDTRAGSGAAALFYAGATIRATDGRVIGTLAVVDAAPRRLTAAQRESLLTLAGDAAARIALCEELRFARAIIDNAPVAIYHADVNGDVTMANPEYRRQLSLGPTDSLRDWANGIHPDDRGRVEGAWRDFCDEPRAVGFQYRSLPRNGASRVLAEEVNPARGIDGFVGSIMDVTERVAARERLQRLESQHRDTFEQAPVGIAYVSREGQLFRFNPAFSSLLGIAAEELDGTTLEQLTYRPDVQETAAEIARLWSGECDSCSMEHRFRRRDRSLVWVRTTAKILRDARAEPECLVGFFQDITAQKEIDAALEGNRNTLEAIIADVPVAILACNLAGQILLHNRAAADMFAIPSAGVDASVGPGAYAIGVEVLLPDSVTPVSRDQRPLVRALRGETITDMELIVRRAGAPDRSTLNSARQLFGQYGEILGAVVVAQDITQRKDAEIALERVHRQLLDASRLAGMAEVATNVLHNVGNVLNSVNVAASRVADKLRDQKADGLARVAALLEERSADLATFISNDERGRGLPHYLTKLARQLKADQCSAREELAVLDKHLEHIKDTVSMQQSYARLCGVSETVAVEALIEDCLRMNSGALSRHGVSVQREIADVAPITVDKHKVLQILVNLVRNAKYACDESGRSDRLVTIRVEDVVSGVRIAVVDNGVGIDPDDMSRLFRHGFTTRQSGHGFGLHSAALAARELGGTLTAASEGRGQGATFTLELPREVPRA